MALTVTRETARGRHYDYVLPNGTHISLDTYLGNNLVTLATEGGGAPGAQDTSGLYPMAYLVRQSADSEIQAHYHQADQFQLFVHGTGRIGTHALHGLTLHYAGALSPYGPIVSQSDGLQYLTFRNRWDPGDQCVRADRTLTTQGCGRKLGLVRQRFPEPYGVPWGCVSRATS